MTDRAYIVSRTLETKIAIAENNDQNTLIVTLDVLKEILALLKEQEAVVRCVYCNRRGTYDCPVYVGGDGMHSEPDDWFCADGKRKEVSK